MTIKVQHGDVVYIVDTPEEAVRIGTLLAGGDDHAEPRHPHSGTVDLQASADETAETHFAWTPELLGRFIERLGESQRTVLSVLIARRHVPDEYLRDAVGVADNQALAGVLSGISKQATALGIPPRAVFSFANLRRGGKRHSLYSISPSLPKFADELDNSTGENNS